jgi:hypothetical protein
MPRKVGATTLIVMLFGGFALLTAACSMGRSPEEQVLNNFFRAARVRDNATLANISAVSFDARTDGTVQDFEITNVGEEQRRTLQIKQLAEGEEKAKQDDADFARKKREYQDANLEAIERVVKLERSGSAVRGKDAEVQAAWSKWRDEQSQYQRRLSEARQRHANERALAVNSLTPPGQPDVDVANLNVELITKQVTVNAEVRDPDGSSTSNKTFVFTMQKANATGGPDGDRDGRWIITGIRPQAGGAPSTN